MDPTLQSMPTPRLTACPALAAPLTGLPGADHSSFINPPFFHFLFYTYKNVIQFRICDINIIHRPTNNNLILSSGFPQHLIFIITNALADKIDMKTQ